MKNRSLINIFSVSITLLLAISVALSFWQSYQMDKLLASSSKVYLCNSLDPESQSFLTLKDKYSSLDSTKYFAVINKITDTIDFDFAAIDEPSGFELIAIGSNIDSTLIRVYIYRNSPTLSKPRQEFHWIWKGFLTTSKCDWFRSCSLSIPLGLLDGILLVQTINTILELMLVLIPGLLCCFAFKFPDGKNGHYLREVRLIGASALVLKLAIGFFMTDYHVCEILPWFCWF